MNICFYTILITNDLQIHYFKFVIDHPLEREKANTVPHIIIFLNMLF